MFHFFFKNIFYLFILFVEVLKDLKNIVHFFKKWCSNCISLNSIVFSMVLCPDENTYYVFFSFFDLLFFSSMFNFSIFLSFLQYTYFWFLSNISFVSIYSILFIYFFFGFFLLFIFFLFVFFFLLFSFILNFIEILFKTKLAGLVMFSKDFLSIEDEDLWVSSTIFYFDNKVLEAKDFKAPLSIQEIEVFQTIIKLFFHVPSKNSEYLFFSNELLLYRNSLKNYLSSEKTNPSDAEIFFLKLKFKPFEKFPAYSSSIKSFNQTNEKSPSNTFLFKYFKPFYTRSFFGFFFHLSNFVFPSEKRRKFKDKVQKYEKRVYLRKRTKAFRKYMKGYYFFKYGLIYKSKDEKNTKFTLLNPNKRELPNYVRNQIKNENIYWQNRQVIINYYKSFKDNLHYFSSSTNFPIDTFKFFRESSLYNNMNNKSKMQRFRKFFWFSFPFYILEVTWNLRSFFYVTKIPYFFLYFYKMVLSKIFYVVFFLFGDLIINANYDPSIKATKTERNFFRFLTIKSNTNKAIPELLNNALSQLFSFSPEFSSDTNSNEKKDKSVAKSQNQSNRSNDFKIQNKITEKPLSIRKRRRYQRYQKRKKGTLKKVFLQNSKKYSFSNKYNSQSFFSQPKIEMVDFYKLLEYFYFVLTNDIDFYENAQFLAKVALLRQKYGQPIVSDLLNREDHKQASKVSVQMHVVDYEALSFTNSQKQESNLDFNTTNSNNESEELEKLKAKNSFYMNQSKSVFYRKPNNLIDDLVLSYKYRFKN